MEEEERGGGGGGEEKEDEVEEDDHDVSPLARRRWQRYKHKTREVIEGYY